MKNFKFLLSFIVWLILAYAVAGKLNVAYHIHPAITLCSLAVLSLLAAYLSFLRPADPNVYTSDLTVDVNIWGKEIIKRLFKNNAFMSYAVNESKYVHGGAVVLIPQPGARPTVVKNRGSFPATAVRRSDSVISYLLDEYSTDPQHVLLNELSNISYAKMDSVIQDLFGYLLQDVADDMIIKWLTEIPEANIINTSGAATGSLENGQDGNRLAMTWQDLRNAARVMNKANVLSTGRVALLEENMYQQLVDSIAATPYKDFNRDYDAAEGVVGRLFGFDIMTRSTVGMAARALDSGVLDVNPLDAAANETDDVTCLCWQRDSVCNATGKVNLFTNAGDALYYGDVNSTSIRSGGRVRRADYAGVIAIKQAGA